MIGTADRGVHRSYPAGKRDIDLSFTATEDRLDRGEQVGVRNQSASASRKVTQLIGVTTAGDPAVQLSSLRARVERFLIGSGMAAVAWLLEKAVLRSMKKKVSG